MGVPPGRQGRARRRRPGLPDVRGSNDVGTAVLLAAMATARWTRWSWHRHGRLRQRAVRLREHGARPRQGRAGRRPGAGAVRALARGCGRAARSALVTEDARWIRATGTRPARQPRASPSAWARATGGSVAALRYHNVYGPGCPATRLTRACAAIFTSALARGQAPRVFEDGGQRRDFVHVHDVAAANVMALTRGRAVPGAMAVYNVGSGAPRTVGEVSRRSRSGTGGQGQVVTGEYRARGCAACDCVIAADCARLGGHRGTTSPPVSRTVRLPSWRVRSTANGRR